MEIESGPDRYMASYSHLWVLCIIIITKLGNPEFLKSWTKKKKVFDTDKSDFEGGIGVWSRKADVAEGGSLHARRGRPDPQASQDWDAKVGHQDWDAWF